MYLCFDLFIIFPLYVHKLMSINCNLSYFLSFLLYLFPLSQQHCGRCGDGGSVYVCVVGVGVGVKLMSVNSVF